MRVRAFLAVLSISLICPAASHAVGTALRFDGTNDYVNFGPTNALNAGRFTVETWFMIQSTGTPTSTGAGGVPDALPLLGKGAMQNEGSITNMNYLLGIDQSAGRLIADFEEGDLGAFPGMNHPVTGNLPIVNGVWNHAATTYDGTNLNIYLNGALDITAVIGQPPQSNSIQHAGLAASLNTVGSPFGFFGGTLDEPRIWNVARSQQQIISNMQKEVASASGLVGRWGLNEGTGTNAANSAGSYGNGALFNSPAWVRGYPFSEVGVGGLYFDGDNDYVNLGTNSALGLATFTLETWFKRLGNGDVATTGSGGITNFIPLITKGRGGVGSGTNDVNYVLGIDADSGVLIADFEEGAAGTTPGANHPVSGITPILSNVWYHAAVTYDGSSWNLYLNGALETGLSVGEPPRFDSVLAAGLGTTFDATNNPDGFFSGVMDEVRIWNHARSPAAIASNVFVQILSATGLVSRWSLNETNGFTAANSINVAIPGTLVNGPVWAQGSPFAVLTGGLYFDGVDDQVAFGPAPSLGATNFTIETWFKKLGPGVTTTTGTGGVGDAIPLVTKGRGEADNPSGGTNVDMNYFLGIRASDNILFADMEEGAGGTAPSSNHIIVGTTPILDDVWYHVAATYNGTWSLYLNGMLQSSVFVGQPPRADSIQHAGLGSAYTSVGAAEGFFNGVLDEVRIWNYARSATEVTNSKNIEITSAVGLLGRWGLNESNGLVAANSANPSVPGVLSNGPIWTAGAPLNPNLPPTVVLTTPANGATNVSTNATLIATTTDPEGTNLTVTFYGRVAASAGPDFTIIALPDTQYYVSSLNGGTPEHFISQTEWIISNRVSRNIKFVTHLGDCTEHGSTTNESEWLNATNALYRLEDPVKTSLAQGIPWGLCVGNHDQSPNANADGSTLFYNQYFGTNHFAGRAYYGGSQAITNNDDHYELFTASGIDFVIIHLEYDESPSAAVLAWANGILQTYSNRLGILASHYFSDVGTGGAFGTQGAAVYNALKTNVNFSLMLCGHRPGEGRRQDTFEGRTVHCLLSDYQGRSGGGDGWLRIYEFSPSNNIMRAKTYSTTLATFESDADSEFTIPYAMTTGTPYTVIAVLTNVPSGSNPSVIWSNRAANTTYEWYAEASDGANLTASPVFSFRTGASSCTDCDGDGMPDAYEIQQFGTTTNGFAGDVDGDGMSNGNEFLSGTQPTNAASIFRLRSVTSFGTTRSIIANTEPARKYKIAYYTGYLTTNVTWSFFGNTNNGFGTWIETNTVPTTHTFVDDQTTNSTFGAPPLNANGRVYRVTTGP